MNCFYLINSHFFGFYTERKGGYMNEEKVWLDAVMDDGETPVILPAEGQKTILPATEEVSEKTIASEDAVRESDPLQELFSEEMQPPLPSQEPQKPVESKKKPSPVSGFVELAEVIVGSLVTAILVLTLICRTGVVDGTSMVPTMHHGDRYLISDLFYTPEQGDIVVFRPEVDGDNELWIKRVVAVEGQTVYINPNDYKVYVDGKALDEPYLDGAATLPKSTENPITVPEGSVYVLGDNRSISHDSRYKDLGCVPVSHLAGRVVLRFWPLSDFGFCE